jgi:hypothetical protein
MLKFRIWLNSNDSFIIPLLLNTTIKNKEYSIRFENMEKHDLPSQIALNDGKNDLGIIIFRHIGIFFRHLEVNTLQAFNMIHNKESNSNNNLEIPYDNAMKLEIRSKNRIPVGTLLIEAVKLIAYENGIQTIELSSKTDAEGFYRKIGWEEIKGGSGLTRFRFKMRLPQSSPQSSRCSGLWCSRKRGNKKERIRSRRIRSRRIRSRRKLIMNIN